MAKLSQTKSAVPEGASFELMTNTGFKDRTFTGNFYLYSPSKPHLDFMMSPMLNSVIFVYPNKPYASKAEAWEALVNTGLLDMAEKEIVYVIMPLAVKGDKWSGDDLMTYYDSQYYLAGGDIYVLPGPNSDMKMDYQRRVYNNNLYIIAAGDGATFVNNFLSQHAGRIAGVLTFGGHIDKSISAGAPLPAYLVNADKSAIAYYKEVNKVDTEVKSGVFENSGYNLKKVITAKGDDNFDADIIADAWTQIFSRTTKVCFSDNVVLNTKNNSEWILMDRPNYKELGITRIDHIDEKLPDGTQIIWCDFVPNSVLADKKTKVPLVITLHGGGDDPIYHVESNGWAAKAAEKGFVVVSPNHPGPTEAGENIVLNILEYAKKTYPIDENRVYVAGFSGGGCTTAFVGLRNADKFTAVTVMGSAGFVDDKIKAIVNSKDNKTDLPFGMIIGTKDVMFATDENGNMCLPEDAIGNGKPTSKAGPAKPLGGEEGLKHLLKINKLELGRPDYAAYPYWGYPTEDAETLTDKGLKYHVSYIKKGGKAVAKLVLFENAGHSHSEYFATLAWDFFSRFTR